MDPRINPFSPGAGTAPPELAGREKIIEDVSIALHRIRSGNSAKSVLMVGLRGVGKTVLLNRLKNDAEAEGIVCVQFESPENRNLPAMLVPSLRAALLKLNRMAGAKDLVARAVKVLGSFIAAAKVKYEGMEFGFDLDHKYSIYEGFKNNIDSKIIGHYKNLEILKSYTNRNIKNRRSSILIEDLLKEIESIGS